MFDSETKFDIEAVTRVTEIGRSEREQAACAKAGQQEKIDAAVALHANDATQEKIARAAAHATDGSSRATADQRAARNRDYAEKFQWPPIAPTPSEREAALHAQFKDRRQQRAAMDVAELRDLREAVTMRLWSMFGCATMVEYMERYAGYQPHTSFDRLRVAEALTQLPAMEAALEQGALFRAHGGTGTRWRERDRGEVRIRFVVTHPGRERVRRRGAYARWNTRPITEARSPRSAAK